MSSFTSTNGSSPTEHVMNNAKNYICPKCNRNYDFQMGGNNFVGRIPLILNCKHSVCQECVYKMYPSKDIICPECHASNFITDIESRKKADQVFSVNFYVFGALTYHKRYGYETPTVNFKPAGFQFKHSQQHRRQDYQPNSFLSFSVSPTQQYNYSQLNLKVEERQQVCSQENCKNEANVNCADCDELYCKQCCDTIHNAAKGLKKHKITPLSSNDCLELTEACSIHADALVEFICESCDKNLCCYCILSDHSGHTFHQMTKLNDQNMDEFRNLVENAEEVLKRLIMSEKKAKQLLQKPTKVLINSDTSIEQTISRKIENAIAKLQMLEKELLAQAQRCKNQDRTSLIHIMESLLANIRSVSNLVKVGKQVLLDTTASPKKLNIHLIKKQLEGVSNTACYFLQNVGEKENMNFEFTFDESVIEDLQHSSRLNIATTNSYSLVTRNELPPDYEDENELETTTGSMMSSASSFIDNLNNKVKEKRPKKNLKYDNVEKWIQSTSNSQQQKKINSQKDGDLVQMPTFQKGDRETVKVMHLTSPDCFYVQLRKMSGALNRLSKSIEKYTRSNSILTVQVPEINNLYLVKYISDGHTHWCRGRIIDDIPEQKVFVVYFIDYGNTGTVRREDIATIPQDMKRPIPFAVKCKFFDLYPPKGEWNSNAVFLMTKIIANNELLMIVTEVSPDILEVDLITTDCDTSVRDALKFLGYGIPYCKYPTELDKIKKQLKSTENMKLYNKVEQYKKEESMEVIVSYAINPHNVYVNFKNGKTDLTKLHEAMHNFYRQNKKGYIYSPKEDMVVAVLYSDGISSSWRRGIITESSEGRGMVTARLVDIGMVISVPWDQIRKLDARFVAQDCQAKLIKMAHIIPPKGADVWPQNAVDFFTKFIKTETVLKMVISETTDPPEVVLFECYPAVHLCLNARLVKDGLAESTGDLSLTVEWSQFENEQRKPEDESFTISMLKTIQATNHHQETFTKDVDSDDEEMSDNIWKKPIEVISSESPDLIHVTFTENKETFHAFQLELKHFYTKNKLEYAQWEVGNVCVVYHRKRYYRGIILGILANNKYFVTLNDCAMNVEVKGSQLGILDVKFKQEPQFAIRCHLADITPAGGTGKWSAMACELLQDLLGKNEKLYLAKKGVIDKERKSMPVVIWYTEFLPGSALESSKTILHSVNKELMTNGLALKADVNKTNQKGSGNKEIALPTGAEENLNDKKEDGDSIKSASTETEDHECSSSSCSISVAGALKPSTSTKIDWNDLIEMQKQCHEQIIRDWLAPVPFKRNEFAAIPTFVNDDGEIFLHDIEMEPLLKDMEKNMLEYFNSRTDSDIGSNWSPGEMCSVKYFANKKWYRGKILSVNGSTIKVVMVDYGNEDECSAVDLSKEILYYDLPVFANKIVLDNILPKQNRWLTSDLDILHAQIVDKEVDVRLITQQIIGLPTPAIVKLGDLNINDFIIKHSKNLTRIDKPKSIISSISSSVQVVLDSQSSDNENDVIIEETDSSNEVIDVDNELQVNFDEIKLGYKQFPLPVNTVGEKFDIVVINMASYNIIVFEIPSSGNFEKGNELFDKMSEDINLLVPHQSALKSYEVGQKCVARFDDQWYRAQVVKAVDDDEAYVWYVDFGNFEKVKLANMKQIQAEWLDLAVDHYVAKIAGIKVKNEGEIQKVIDQMVSNCDGAHMCYTAEIVTQDPLRLKLYKQGTTVLAYQNLIDSGLLESTVNEWEQEMAKIEKESEESIEGIKSVIEDEGDPIK